MKIVYFINSISILAGTERIIVDKMNYLANHGYSVYLITHEQGNHSFSFDLDEKIRHYDLNVRFFTLYKYNLLKRLYLHYKMKKVLSIKLEKVIKNINPDIFICTTYSIDCFKQIVNTIGSNYKKILESHVYLPFLLKDDIRDNSHLKKYAKKYSNCKNLKYIRYFDKIVVLTKEDGLNWEKYTQKISIITNSITNISKRINRTENNHCILCVGRLGYQKGFDLLIKAWSKICSKHKDWHIDIYGEGREKEFLEKEIKKHDVGNSLFIKEPTKYIYDRYQNSELFVLSSRFEGFGLVLAEAMSCGTPCVSFNCPGVPDEIITNGVDGLLAKNGDIDDLADKIEWMITHEKERKEMGIKARESAKRYDKDVIMAQWIKLFDEISKG